MKTFLATLAGILILTGCASFEEAYHLDREFGEAAQTNWQQQVAYPERPYANNVPQKMEGITAEQVMEVHIDTFGDPPEGGVDLFSLDLSEGSGSN